MTRNTLIVLVVLLMLLEFLGCLDTALHGTEPMPAHRRQIRK